MKQQNILKANVPHPFPIGVLDVKQTTFDGNTVLAYRATWFGPKGDRTSCWSNTAREALAVVKEHCTLEDCVGFGDKSQGCNCLACLGLHQVHNCAGINCCGCPVCA